MTTDQAIRLLDDFRQGRISRQRVLNALWHAPFLDLGFAKIDHQRHARKGFPEVVFGEGKSPQQIIAIAREILRRSGRVLITRLIPDHARTVKRRIRRAVYHETARCMTIETSSRPKIPGMIAVLSAGTSDLPVAEEAAVTAEIMGSRVERIMDVGVAGLHRLLTHLDTIRNANVVVAVAGMEGALPSVVAGLIPKPVIAVPTSIGYGASYHGLAALLGMLNSCGSGVTVVNIDNGFGAGYAAGQINAVIAEAARNKNRTGEGQDENALS